jgi:hypothetical protein
MTTRHDQLAVHRRELLPSIVGTLLTTVFFGVFGLIPATLNSGRARRLGVRTARYWVTFGLVFVVQCVLFLWLVTAAIAGS